MSDVLPWFRPEAGGEEKEAVLKVLDSNYLNDGPTTRAFEAAAAARLGARYAVGVTSGTAAISLALMACGVRPGDTVIVPDLTFIATANAARMFGANVRLVDVEPQRLTISLAAIEAAFDESVTAVVTVDVNGRCPDYDTIREFCRARGVALVCDAAEAFGSAHKGQLVGSLGDASCFSFSAAKTICTGQGGLVTTDDPDIRQRLIELKDQGRPSGGTGGDDDHPVLGFNFKYTSLQAAVGLAQLGRLDERIKGFRLRDRLYRERLADCPGVILLPDRTNEGEVLQWMDALFDDRASVKAALEADGIGCRAFWHPLHSQVPYQEAGQDFPHATACSARGLWLPSYFGIGEPEIDRVCTTIRKASGRRWV